MIPLAKLGSEGLITSRLGLGCMGMSEFYGHHDDAESLRVLDRAVDLGIVFWDTADMYGPYTNEVLVGKSLKKHRQKILLATKFGFVRGEDPAARGINGRPEYVMSSCEGSLKRLETDMIDLYYLHRKDPNTPIEDTVGAMAKLVSQGKIRGIGLSEVSVETLRKAHAVHPITAVQSEYSLWTRDPEEGMLKACKELGIAFVAYSPLGRGFLTGQIKRIEDFEPDDWRRFSPRFQGDNFRKNLDLVDQVAAIAAEKQCTPSQLALAWVLAQGEHIFPIPGTKRIKYLEENAAAFNVQLNPDDLSRLHEVFSAGVAGDRYPELGMKFING
ncbi:aldo/keto reductase [Flavihumibacter fluvii]|uniref:aldo/keto reductase n=1 Tax=Flavihumibacter fluvii TaxID=2838157 RepID=UPI001EFA8575|nr:aldo/keto reductase [Flavihumibacter fluvii]ULQ53273.1 aldo/keto reductase [Flavihumibacter fluvii]